MVVVATMLLSTEQSQSPLSIPVQTVTSWDTILAVAKCLLATTSITGMWSWVGC